ncbi:MAG: hypothetical protein GF375_03230 [Candidatus Omnitrophica bacterium]|nr:hypothetical protein [Candidatus Omnitrophota bacterium]MBD3269096.1 hypothetical protein [Candidatus Omnitrophota bacterium]
MKIIAPFSEAREIIPLKKAGADELYCGFWPSEFVKEKGILCAANRRYGRRANFVNPGDLSSALAAAADNGIGVSVVLNEFYSPSQYELILKVVGKLVNLNPDSLIVSDLGLVTHLRSYFPRLKLIMSVMGTTFNSYAAQFYGELGILRIVLPRRVPLSTIKKIREANPELQFESIILNMGCPNIDGFCGFQHGLGFLPHKRFKRLVERIPLNFALNYLPLFLSNSLLEHINTKNLGCSLNYRLLDSNAVSRLKEEGLRLESRFSHNFFACGVCRLPLLRESGVEYLKIAGRGNPLQKKIKDIKFLKRALDIFESGKPGFEENCRNLRKDILGIKCRDQDCYYVR